MNQGMFCLLFKRRRRKKSLREFKRLCGIFCYFSSQQKCWQGERWNYISYSWSGTRPQAKKGNVLLNVTYWKDGEQRVCETKKKWKERKKRGGTESTQKTEGRENEEKRIMAHYWGSGWPGIKEQNVRENRFNKTRRPLGFKIAAQGFITRGEKRFSSFL